MAKIKLITDVVESVAGVTLLDVDPGADTNRTVVTFVGAPEAVAEAAFLAVQKACEVLDMTTHHGAHPRFGATDVCPFVPVEGVTMEDCAELARKVGKRIGEELDLPVYLYENAAATEERRNLANVRRGEYEGLKDRVGKPEWKPDFGPDAFNAKAGAIAVGAREFLIAYNITLNTRDKAIATDIAFELREKGRVARTKTTSPLYSKGEIVRYGEGRYPCGNCEEVFASYDELKAHCAEVHGYDLDHLLALNNVPLDAMIGRAVYRAGKYQHCKAIGWFVDEYERAQISINLTDYHITSPQEVLEATRELAMQRGVVVTGSEIVGLVPFQALYEAGIFYLDRQGKTPGVPVQDVLSCAVHSMGLTDVSGFDIDKRVLGLPQRDQLVMMRAGDLADEVSRDTPAPGGGSIAAYAGALGASLASMVAALTHGKGTDMALDQELRDVTLAAQKIKDELIRLVDEDTNAFNGYMDALRLPKDTAEQKAARTQKMQEELKGAVEVPLRTARLSLEAMKLADIVARRGNPNSITDGAVGCQAGFTGVRGGTWNVAINLKDIKDTSYVRTMQATCADLLAEASALLASNGEFVDSKITQMISKRHS